MVCNNGILKRFEKQIGEDRSFDENSSTSSDISVNSLSHPVSDRGPKQLAVTLPIPPLKDVGSKDQSLLCEIARRCSQTRKMTRITALREDGPNLQRDALPAK